MAATNPEVPTDVSGLNRKYAEVTKRLELLEALSADIAAGRLSEQLRAECPELAKKTADVEKLRYRAGIMKRRIAELDGAEKKRSPPKEQKLAVKYVRVLDYGHSILERLVAVFGQTVKQVGLDVAVQLRETTNLNFGDYQFDSCPLIAKKLADAGVRLSPVEVAARLMAALPPVDLVARVEGAKFFINVFLEPRVVGQRGVAMPELERRVVCIDFSSPNIAKQMHVGHLRSTIIGESMARLLEFVGYDVRRINHIGDWGTHRADFQEIYRRLDVRIEERGESFYQERMKGVVQLLEERKLLSDGGFTYDTSDLATIQHRLFEERAEWLLYVVDAGQAAHFETIFAAARHLGWYEREKTRVEHVQFGVVLGDDKKKFKTRSGDTVRLTDLLDEGVLSTEEMEAAKEAVAYGCIRYADLQSGRVSDYVFSFDRMLDDRGNTAAYLLYAHARICSIIRTAGVDPERTAAYVDALPDGVLPLDHPAELKLGKQLLRLSDVLLTVLESLHLHKLCDYVYQLTKMLSDFYKECYVVEKREDGPHVNLHRLVLCEVAAQVMRTCFKILGIRPLEKM
ncbi:putative arginine--tRNA ligase, cytoplasmic [Aphelenchoides fujianensis]|nr:putative arginine--tRNA ligase, cytoplasmic [Aphelenchoides fujianensis]